MGKMKHKKSRGQRNQPTGLLSVQDCEAQEEAGAVISPVSGSINKLIEKLQSPSEDERECTCAIIASLTEQQGAVQQLLSAKAVKVIGPQLLAKNDTLKLTALGSLRNISVEGGINASEEMVSQDIMTPLVGMFKQFEWDTSDKIKTENQTNMFEQALHLLWNLCEASETAVSIFNQQNLLQYLLPCLDPSTHGINVALAAAQCLYVVSEGNASASAALCELTIHTSLHTLAAQQHQTQQQLLLRTLAAGILYNSHSSPDPDVSLVSVLSSSLDTDLSGQLVAVEALHNTLKMSLEAPNSEASMAIEEEKAECKFGEERELNIKHETLDKQIEECNYLLQAQQTAIELLANMCCMEDDDDEEGWEDSSDTSHEDDQMMSTTQDAEVTESPHNYEQSMGLSPAMQDAFRTHSVAAKVLSKTEVPNEELCARLAAESKTQPLIKRLCEIEIGALLCLGNLVGGVDITQLGGMEHLHALWQRLALMAGKDRVCQNPDLLEAVTSVMQTTVLKLTHANSPKLTELTEEDVNFLYKLSTASSSSPDICVNVIRVVSAIGQALSKIQPPHTMMKPLGEFLLRQCSSMDAAGDVWVVAEALDAIMDVFAEDHINPVLQEIQLIPTLTALAPSLKRKVKQERKHLGEHLPIVMTVKTNLPRFIQYKNKLLR